MKIRLRSSQQMTLTLTCFTTHSRTPVTRAPHQNQDASSIKSTMASTHNVQKLQKVGRLALSKKFIQNKQVSSVYKAANLYDVPESTLRDRIKGSIPIAQSNAKKRKLQPSEEQALVQWILDLDRRGFPPQIIDARRMADTLLAARG